MKQVLMILVLMLGCFGAFGQMAVADPAEEHTFEQLLGDWYAETEERGAVYVRHLSLQPALNNKFVGLDYAIAVKTEEGATTVFSGAAFYKNDKTANTEAFWADSNGDLMTINANWVGTALMAEWSNAEGRRGKTEYAPTEAGNLRVTDWVYREDDWQQFSQVTLERLTQED